MKKRLGSALSSGIIFGIVSIFLYLIGFTTTISQIIQHLLKLGSGPIVLGLDAQTFSFALFMTVIGLWAGAR